MRSTQPLPQGTAAGRRKLFPVHPRRPLKPRRTLSAEPLEPRMLLAANPIINEFLARNDGGLRDGDGRSSDWIEIFNAGDMAVDLAGYHLTDDAENLTQWTFPSVTLDPGQYLVVFASGQDRVDYVDAEGSLHTNFTLRRGGDYVALVDPAGSVVSAFGAGGANFAEQLANVSYGGAQLLPLVDFASEASYWVPLDDSLGLSWTEPDFDAAGRGFVTGTAAMGFETRPANRTNFVGQFDTQLPEEAHAVYARMEFDLNDASAISNLQMNLKYDNGFVAYLNGVRVAQENAPDTLAWYSTAPSSARRDTEALELVPFDLTEHVDALVDGTNVLAIHGLNNTSDKSDMLLVVELSAAASDMLAATGAASKVGYLSTPTPGAPNGSNDNVFLGFVGDTHFSAHRGFYDAPVNVEITSDTAEAEIRYTTDGSAPTATHGMVYTGPVTISETTPLRAAAFLPDFLPTNVDTQTYLFLEDVIREDGAGLPDTWGRFVYGSTEAQVGDPVPANYEMDPEVVNDPRYRDTIRDDLRSLPTLSLVMDPDDLWDADRGIYANPVEGGIEWERPASAELIGTDGSTEFQVDAGARIHGGFGRRPAASAKHSIRLLFKRQYGPTKLDYPWFGDDQVHRFDTLVMRANYNYSWSRGNRTGTQTGQYYTMVTDRWASVTQQQMGGLAPNGTFVHLYINGLYWGVYNPTERPDASFQAEHQGGDKSDYDVLTQNGVTDGDDQAWTELQSLLRQRPIDYEAVKGVLDVSNFIDYMILNQFGGNNDWPQNNWYASRRREPDAKWQFHSWDAEFFFIGMNDDRIRTIPNDGPGEIYNALRDVDEFRLEFADHIHRHLFNDGVLTPEANRARLTTLAEPLDRAVVGESARWGDAWMNQVSPPRTRDDDWIPRLDELRDVYFPQRNGIVVNQYRRAGIYPDAEAPEWNQHGGPVPTGFPLSIRNPGGSGTVYYTLDGGDPRLPDGSVNPQAMVFDGTPIPLRQSHTARARVLVGDEWSALTEAEFVVTDLRMSEINYNPHPANPVPGLGEAEVDHDQFEFVELYNTGSDVIDLSGAKFTRGFEFTFPDPTTVNPGERILVVKDQPAFESRYGPGRRVVGQFVRGDLSDDGELIELRDAQDQVLVHLRYDDSGDWPGRADGHGSSLEMADPLAGAADPLNWRDSSQFGGSPGSAAEATDTAVVINEVLAHAAPDETGQIELYNSGSATIAIGHWYLTNSREDYFEYPVPDDTSVPNRGYLILDETELGFTLDGERGGDVWLVAADASGKPTRFVAHAQYPASPVGVSTGAWPTPDSPWRALVEPTFGSRNTGPRTGEVVVSELAYSPVDPDGAGRLEADDFEFIELYNRTDVSVDLTAWRLTGTTEYEFPEGTVVGPRETVLVVGFDPSDARRDSIFRFTVGLDPSTVVLGPYSESLDDAGGLVRLERPSGPPPADPEGTPMLLVDEVRYQAAAPWPPDVVGTGNTLTRSHPTDPGDLPTSWRTAVASAGDVAFPLRIAGDSNEDGRFDPLDLTHVLQAGKYLAGPVAAWSEGDWNRDGQFDMVDLVTALQQGRYDAPPRAAVAREPVDWVPAETEPQAVDLLFENIGKTT